jgi:hypothetical protein
MVERRDGNYNGPRPKCAGNAAGGEDDVNSELHTQLESLRVSLARADSLDAESRALLIQLLPEITRLLGKTQPREDIHPLIESLEALAVRFEAEHPALGTALRQVVDALGKAGI